MNRARWRSVRLVAVLWCACAATLAAQWPMDGGNPGRTNTGTTYGPVWPSARWTFDVVDPVQASSPAFGTPVVGPDGSIYVSTPGRFYALRPDASVKWQKDAPAGREWFAAALSPDGAVVYSISLNTRTDTTLVAMSAADGATAWEYVTPDSVRFSPAVDDEGTVYVDVGIRCDCPTNAGVLAVRADGTLKWHYATTVAPMGMVSVDSQRRVYFVRDGGYLVALSESGQVRWQVVVDPLNSPTPPARATVGADGTIYTPGTRFNSPSFDQGVRARDGSGAVKWLRDDLVQRSDDGMALSEDGTTLYVARDQGRLFALSAATGATIWSATVAGASLGWPLVARGVVYVPTTRVDGSDTNFSLTAFSSATGALRWEYALTCAAACDRVSLALGEDETLFALVAGRNVSRLFALHTAFSDDPVVAGATAIKATHIRELRARVDALRSALQLEPVVWTDDPLVAAVTVVKANHLAEVRSALADVYAALGLPEPAYTNAVQAGDVVKAVDINETRAAVSARE